MSLPADVAAVAADAAALVHSALPGCLRGLYLHGSLGWGEWFSTSDIDFVATLVTRPTASDIDSLRAVHEQLRARHPARPYDGFYVLEADLARPPSEVPDHPGVLGETFSFGHHCDANLVTWHELAGRGITVHGPEVTTLRIHTDLAALQDYSRANLDTYWRSQAVQVETVPAASTPEVTAWAVLGIARLHHLLQTGRITSKSGAGRWARESMGPEWRPIIDEALSVREMSRTTGAFEHDPDERRRQTAQFMRVVLCIYC